MVFRIFIAVIALVCVFIGYDSAVIAWGKAAAQRAENGQVQASADADITVVEFLDYSCPQCQNLHPVLTRALERDGKVRLVIKPTFSEQDDTGLASAKLVYAAGRQGKFIEAHNILITNFRTIDDEYARNIAAQLDIDADQLLTDMDDPDIEKTLRKNVKNLQRMKGRVVPSLLIDNKVLVSVTDNMVSSDDLLSLFNRTRRL